MFFNNLETKTFTYNLTTVHKIKDKIFNSLKGSRGNISPFMGNTIFPNIVIDSSDLFSKSTTDLTEELYNNWNEYLDTLILEYVLRYDLNRIKEVIFSKNLESGISELLNKQKNLEMEKNMLSRFDMNGNEGQDLKGYLDNIKEYYKDKETIRGDIKINYLFYNPEQIRERIKEINGRIFEIEDKITALNSQTKASFELFEITVDHLGIS